MAPEDVSNPIVVANSGAIMNTLLELTSTTGRLTGLVEKLGNQYDELRKANSRFATRDELHEHAQQCPGNVRATRTRRPTSGNVPKLNVWQKAQQRLGVIVSVLTLLGILGGAWIYTLNLHANVREKLHHVEVQQKKRDKATQRQVKENLREVLKALKENGAY